MLQSEPAYTLDIKYPVELRLSERKREVELAPNEDYTINCTQTRDQMPKPSVSADFFKVLIVNI